MEIYPPTDCERAASAASVDRAASAAPGGPTASAAPAGCDACPCGARIVAVAPASPADDAGFEPGCVLTSVDGRPLRDIIDWRWLSGEEAITVGYVDLDGDTCEVELWREPGEQWGFEFDGVVFDGVRSCRNACTFCFMHQLPAGMRPSLSVRDDDFRLSFLAGTFVTLTNLTPDDERRIIAQRLSPLRVSLQASDADVRRRLIGRHAPHGLAALERLLAAGIEFHAQIVLVPGENDGDALIDTLTWAYERPGIRNVGIVPLGYTRHQTRFARSFDEPSQALGVLEAIAPIQRRARCERGFAWVFAADEFYCNAYGPDVLAHVPDATFYGDFSLFEDGIGMIRATVDDWARAEREGLIAAAARAAEDVENDDGPEGGATEGRAAERGVVVRMVAGLAQKPFLDALIEQSGIGGWFRPLYVRNDFFGGNVDVTGLLTGGDIAAAVREARAERPCDPARARSSAPARAGAAARTRDAAAPAPARTRDATAPARNLHHLYLVPRVVFNDDGLTLDDCTLADMEKAAGAALHMVSCSPSEYFEQVIALANAAKPQWSPAADARANGE